ncbi:hypothetical protein [Fusobacterium mortiferum]|uniref:Uncharacterized protein n=1 Tax=Fusobacterium mortiferum TaxID=850 RepID=A0ABS2G093_FUSMR|nr:hypothetical protein [Fusobacterium mortiferum]MBM6874425.1 hypothetical protein [Fusobacterium mortiferum]
MIYKIAGILYITITLFNTFTIIFREVTYFPNVYKDNKKNFCKAIILLVIYLLFSPIIFSILELNEEK